MTQQTPALIEVDEAIVETRYSSVTLVDDENKIRKEAAELAGVPFPSEGYAKLRHDHFMDKVEKHPGIVAPNFRGYYVAENGKRNPCYYLPKRESCIMAMSYSLALQAKVFDHWVAAEAKLAQLSADTDLLLRLPPPETQAVWDAGLRVAQTQMNGLMNTKGKKAMIAAVENAVGLNATPAQVVAASLEFYNKNAAKFLKMAQPDARESVRQLRLGH